MAARAAAAAAAAWGLGDGKHRPPILASTPARLASFAALRATHRSMQDAGPLASPFGTEHCAATPGANANLRGDWGHYR